MAPGQRMALTACKLAVFTWHGATLEVEGAADVAYVAGK